MFTSFDRVVYSDEDRLALAWKILPPHVWAFITVMTWGLASTLQAAAFNWSGLMAARFFMAVAEAG